MSTRKNLFYAWKSSEEFDKQPEGLGAITDKIFDTAVDEITKSNGEEIATENAITGAISETLEAAWLAGFDYATRLWADK